MGEDFAFEYQLCISLHNFAIFYDFDTISLCCGCFASLRFTRPRGRETMGQKKGEDFAFEYQVCIILHNFAIFSDFDAFSRYRGCIALITFHSSPEDGG